MNRRVLCGAIAVIVAGSVSGQVVAASDAYFVGPYSTNISPTSARVHWVVKRGSKLGTLAFYGGGEKGQVEAKVSTFTGRTKEVLHTATLKNLKPGMVYQYTIRGARPSKSGQFRTPPAPGKKPGLFRFVVYGDTRTRPDAHKSVADAIAKESNLAFVAVTGDMVSNGDDWDQWKEQFFDPAQNYLEKSAVWTLRGNHERSGVFYREHFELPGNELWYSFDFGNVHFAVLDSHLSDEAEHAKMLEWFKKDLTTSKADWTFVLYHAPTYNIGGHASKWGVADVLPILEKHEVDLVIGGHSHIYERFRPIGLPGKKPVIHIVAGGGGAPTYEARESTLLEGGTGYSELHFCVFEIDGNELVMTTKRPDGSTLDRMKLVKKGGKYQRSVMRSMVASSVAQMMAFQMANLTVGFADGPKPGEWSNATLVLDHFPAGAKVTLSAHRKTKGWKVKRASTENPREGIEFRVRAPRDLKLSDGKLDPPLRVQITMEHDGEVTKVGTQPLIVTQETQRRLAKAAKPLAVFRAKRKITVDGSDEDWKGVDPLPRKDGSASSFRFVWDSSGLYGIATVKDSEVAGDWAKPWGADSVHVFIEKDFKRAMKDKNNPNAGAYIFSPGEPGGPTKLNCYVGDRSECPAVKSAWKKTDDGYAIEFAFGPEELAPAELKAGVTVGFNFAHCDGGTIKESFRSDWEWNTPFKWGAITLTEGH